jgi:hypothetical protein
MNKIIVKKCIICDREFSCNVEHKQHHNNCLRRRWDAVTCSKPCSRKYCRIAERIRKHLRAKQLQETKTRTGVLTTHHPKGATSYKL